MSLTPLDSTRESRGTPPVPKGMIDGKLEEKGHVGKEKKKNWNGEKERFFPRGWTNELGHESKKDDCVRHRRCPGKEERVQRQLGTMREVIYEWRGKPPQNPSMQQRGKRIEESRGASGKE